MERVKKVEEMVKRKRVERRSKKKKERGIMMN